MRPSQAKHRAKGEFNLCGLVLSSCQSKACRSPMADSIPEWHEIDFWSSHPINGPALWAIGALMAGVVGVSVWGGDYWGAGMVWGIRIGSGCFVWARMREQWGAEASGWRYAGFGAFGLVTLVQIVRLILV